MDDASTYYKPARGNACMHVCIHQASKPPERKKEKSKGKKKETRAFKTPNQYDEEADLFLLQPLVFPSPGEKEGEKKRGGEKKKRRQ